MDIKKLLGNKRKILILGILILFSLNIIYLAIGYYNELQVLSNIKELSVSMINEDLSKNNLPQILKENKKDLDYTLKPIEDNIFILLVKVRVKEIAHRDYFFLVKSYSRFKLFDTDKQYHIVLLDLQTIPKIKYNFTQQYLPKINNSMLETQRPCTEVQGLLLRLEVAITAKAV